MGKSGRTEKKLAAAGIVMLVFTAALQLTARQFPGFPTWYAHHVYPLLVGSIGQIFGSFPFSVVEICLYLLVFLSLVYIFSIFWKKGAPGTLVARTVFLCSALLFLYTCNCGINYYAMPFSEYAGLTVEKYSKEELYGLCEYLTEQVNETATDDSYRPAWRGEGVRAMQAASETFPALGGFYPQPKPVAVSWILSVQQLCGIYSPFTIEANFNRDMPDYNIPHTICHELSHLKGFMREDEANFIGYLACVSSADQAFQYSGYLTGWVYAGNALAGVDRDGYIELYGRLCDQALTDLAENNAFWDRYEGKVAEVSNQMNDVYLKINRQEDGVKSYGRMVDLMLEYYRAK